MSSGAIVVYAGPSLPAGMRPADPLFRWEPPASAGDALRLLDRPPRAVCLIDGFFDHRPAPWHKELMLLASRGVALFGAASMGALRAAELGPSIMTGVGSIHRAYRDGLLTGDDEVACVHAPGELGWAPLTVPMVEVRATLLAARRARLVDRATARTARSLAHDIYFADRDWPAIERAWAGLMSPETVATIRMLHVPLKRMDAQACLARALRCTTAPSPAPDPPRTCYLDKLIEEAGSAITSAATSVNPASEAGGRG